MKALITGASGQDGPYLATALANRGYEVWGCVPGWDPRRHDVIKREPRMRLIDADVMDEHLAPRLLDHVEPDVVYNLAAMSFVGNSFSDVETTVTTNGLWVTRLLEAVRLRASHVRVYQASTSEMYGISPPPQTETTPFRPVSPYAAAKLLAHHTVHVYRECYGLFAVSGVLFNHESPWRGKEFVTRHVTLSVARAKLGRIDRAPIGDIGSERDWGYAPDYVEAMIAMMEAPKPSDYVVATGIAFSVWELIKFACEIGGVKPSLFQSDPSRMRPRDVSCLRGDASRIRAELGWSPKTRFVEMLEEMVAADIDRVKRGEL